MAARKSVGSSSTKGKKNTGRKSSNTQRKTTNRKENSGKRTTAGRKKKSIEEIHAYEDHQAFEVGITILVISIVSVFLYLSYFQLAGTVGNVVGGFAFGLFGWFAWLLPVFVLLGFTFCIVNQGDSRVIRRVGSFIGIILSLLGLTDLLFGKQIITEYYTSNHVLHKDYFQCVYMSATDVVRRGKFNGGLLGRAVGTVFSGFLGKVGAIVILFALLALCIYIFYGVEMMAHLRKRNARRKEMEEIYDQVAQEEEYKEPSYQMFQGKSKREEVAQDHRILGRTPLEKETGKEKKPQYFDLQRINERLDQMEKSLATQKEKEKQETQKQQMPENSLEKKESIIKEEPVAKKETILPEETLKEEISPVLEQEPLIDAIPIYRNELNRKFGKKAKKGVQEKKEEPVVEKPLEEEPVPEAVFDEKETTESQEERSSIVKKETPVVKQEVAAPEEVLPKEPEIPQKAQPMKSFAHKKEVTDVTPSCQKEAVTSREEKTLEEEKVIPKPSVTAPKRENHGKIGGEDYVSRSDTFNALNDSKVAQEEDKPYELPPIDLLSLPEHTGDETSDSQLRMTASKLQSTLKSFNVNVQMGPVTCGPTVTRYEILPEQGVRVNKITNLADDLKLSLAAPSIRIEAPIPGKAAVGIEVPNDKPSSVYFRELLEGDTFTKAKSDLTFAVGKDIAGKLIMADIAKMPHLLIAGATGSGKSVCINTLIMSILYKADPRDVKLIMIDPKVVELSVYNGIPHLFCPVVTDPKEAAAALNWAVREMMDRYNKFKELEVRNISGYNEKIQSMEDPAAAGYGKMPYLVVIVDEFADLMMVASKEVEDAVCRLAQLARAAGIHLVLATQRPSVNVITGVIKANIPSRIAFSVSSVIDSRTILDKGGAEKLLGKGDMLFFPSGYSEPVRVQGAFVSDKEVSQVVDFLRENNEKPEYNHQVTEIVEPVKEEETTEKKKADYDEYFQDAGRFVIESDRAAAGQLQRRFSIGFNRAGRIIDQLHKAGVVGPAEGTKPRKVLMTMEEFEQMLSGEDPVTEEEMESMVQEMEEAVVTMEEET